MQIGKTAFLLLMAALLSVGCASAKEQPSVPGDTTVQEEESVVSEVSEEESLPEPEGLVLLYDAYLTASATQDGIGYTYTYCLDEDGIIFNAIAEITFPTEEDAARAYKRFLQNGYLNLKREKETLSFCFPKKDCPYFGISYRSMPYLLEDTIYTVTELCPPSPSEESRPDANA